MAYKHTNSKGVTYYLNTKEVTLRGGKQQRIYYFSKDERPEGTVVFRQIRRLPQDAAPHLRHEARGRPRRQDLGRRQEIPHGTLLEGRPRVPRKALSLPDPDRRAATS